MDTPDSGLADPQQTIADLRRQLAEVRQLLGERTAERDEALEQQTATAEVLGVINASPGDLAPVFDAMLEKAMRLCKADFGLLATYDGECFHAAAMHGVPETFRASWQQPRRPGPGLALYRLTQGECVVHIDDVAADDPYEVGNPIRRALVDLGGARSVLWVALRNDQALLGAFVIYRKEVRPFTGQEIALVQNFAAQAVIAMENARLLTETREALDQQTATAEVLQVINASPGDLGPVFEAMLEKATHLCDAAFGVMNIYHQGRFEAVALRNVPSVVERIFLDPTTPQPASDSPPMRLTRGEDIVYVEDLAAIKESSDARGTVLVQVGRARSYVTVALRKDGVLLGCLSAYRQEVRPFADKQIALLQNFAQQAVIAIENARLITETQEALDHQTATAELLGVINSSPGDLKPVFEAMLEKATRLCEASFGVLNTYDGERFQTAATLNVPAAYATYRAENLHTYGPGTFPRRVLDGERLIHVVDLTAEETYLRGDAGRRAWVDLGGARSLLLAALVRDETVRGFLAVYRQEVRPFTDKQIALLRNFAQQAVIAMENARLLTETQEALDHQTTTAEILRVINSSPGNLAPVFDAMVERAIRFCNAVGGALRYYENGSYRAVAMRGMSEEFWEATREVRAHPETGLGRIENGERIVQIADLANAPIQDPVRRRAMLELGGIRTSLWVALRKEEQLLGTFVLYRREVRPFSEKEIGIVESFAQQAVIAIENARLLGELHQRTEEVAELNRGLEARVAEQVEELGRVGRLKRFLAPQLAEMIVSQGDEQILESHRREIVVVFCDLRGYTAFTETAEPEEVLDFLREYHGALGPLVSQFEGTLDQFSGDGIMVFFNDPVPIPDPAERAVNMAVAMREAAGSLTVAWRERGRELGFGAGIAQGYATLGQIGFSERSGYTAIGTVCNVAARLCAEAKDGQILLSQRVNVALKGSVPTEQLGALALKGLTQPVIAYNVPLTSSQPALRVIEGGPPSD